MRGDEIDGHAVRLQHTLQQVRDLLTQALLHSESAREESHYSRQLGDPDDVLVRDVADERVTEKGKGVMLAE
jgi:hypothetical protein